MAEAKTEGLMYKGHPLRRIDNLIYYGTMSDKYIVMMQILESKKENGLDMATKVSLQLQLTDPTVKARDRVVKKGEKSSLYEAMDFASIWQISPPPPIRRKGSVSMKLLMKKAVKAAVFTALTTLALTAFASAEGEIAIGAVCTTGTSLRMRSEPSTSASIVTTLNKSVAVALLDDSTPGWYKINYNGNTGYVSSDYLVIDQDNIFTTYGRDCGHRQRPGERLVRCHLPVRHRGLYPQRPAGAHQQSHQRQGRFHCGNRSKAPGHPLCLRRRLCRRL